MTAGLLVAVSIAAGAQGMAGGQVLNLSCVEALVAVGEARLSGVFSFVQEKDSAAAFADLLVHDKAALKKFLAKVDKDVKVARGVSAWDHETLADAVAILASPLGETLDKPAQKVRDRMLALTSQPTLTLEQLAAKRKAAK